MVLFENWVVVLSSSAPTPFSLGINNETEIGSYS